MRLTSRRGPSHCPRAHRYGHQHQHQGGRFTGVISATVLSAAVFLALPLAHSLAHFLLASWSVAPFIVHAASLPEGPHLVAGAANIAQTGGDNPSMTIRQHSKTALVQWQSFDIGPEASVDVLSQQPDSLLINRVVGDTPTVIAGALRSDGSVWLINPNGIRLVQGNSTDTRALLTSHHDIEPALLLNAARALQPQTAAWRGTNIRHATELNTVNINHAVLPATPVMAREAALARVAIAPPMIPRYPVSPEVASPTVVTASSNLGSHPGSNPGTQRPLSAEPLSEQQLYTWFASPGMSTPLSDMYPFSSDDSDESDL